MQAKPLYRSGCRDDHYLLRDPDAGVVIVLLDGEDRAGCGSERSEDQGGADGTEGIRKVQVRGISDRVIPLFKIH